MLPDGFDHATTIAHPLEAAPRTGAVRAGAPGLPRRGRALAPRRAAEEAVGDMRLRVMGTRGGLDFGYALATAGTSALNCQKYTPSTGSDRASPLETPRLHGNGIPHSARRLP